MTLIHRQVAELRQGGWPVLARKARRLPFWVWQITLTAAVLPLVIACRLARPWRLVRFGFFTTDRIGHFIFDLEYFLSDQALLFPETKRIDLFFFERPPANTQLALMCRRHVFVNPAIRYLFLANQWLPGGDDHRLLPARHLHASRDKQGILHRGTAQLAFTEVENCRGRAYLEMLGCDDPSKVICLVVRDSAYLVNARADRDWSYHNFRDTSIDDYCQIAQTLAEKGYWILRMGKKVHRPLKVGHPRVVDYACRTDRCDFLDVWLMANCFFAISTGLGLDSVADAFRRPQVFVNYLPLMDMEAWGEYLTVPKILSWADSGRSLTLAEQAAHSSLNADHYQKQGINIQDLSSTDISDAVMEFEARLTGQWRLSDDEVALHQRFWTAMRACPEFDHYHGWIHPEARVGTGYLRQAQASLFAQVSDSARA